VIRGALAEGTNELARQLVPFLIAGAVFVPSAVGAVLSYLNNAPALSLLLGLLTALAGALTGLAGTYFGIKSSSEAREMAQQIAAEAQDGDKRAVRYAPLKPRESPETAT
jgi:hypothetical protein